MSQVRHIIAVFALIAVLTFAASADETKPAVNKAVDTTAVKELKNQTLCPVMGGKIDSTVFTDIHGQRVYHCCPMCSAKLKADPDKYFKQAATEDVLFENVQTTCPVSGEKLEDKSVSTDYEGRHIAFCCLKCLGAFEKDPQKYLTKMDEKIEPEKNEKTMDHSGHNH